MSAWTADRGHLDACCVRPIDTQALVAAMFSEDAFVDDYLELNRARLRDAHSQVTFVKDSGQAHKWFAGVVRLWRW
jgi:hypothetical protein